MGLIDLIDEPIFGFDGFDPFRFAGISVLKNITEEGDDIFICVRDILWFGWFREIGFVAAQRFFNRTTAIGR